MAAESEELRAELRSLRKGDVAERIAQSLKKDELVELAALVEEEGLERIRLGLGALAPQIPDGLDYDAPPAPGSEASHAIAAGREGDGTVVPPPDASGALFDPPRGVPGLGEAQTVPSESRPALGNDPVPDATARVGQPLVGQTPEQTTRLLEQREGTTGGAP